jgi:hypothetical protein
MRKLLALLVRVVRDSDTGLRPSHHSRPCLEALEQRDVPSGMTPTAADQLFLAELNAARANPAAYGASIGVDLSYIAPAQPLAFDTRLEQAATLHSQDMNARNFLGHINPDGLDPGQRMSNAGYPWVTWGESLGGGYASVEDALRGLIIDAGVPSLDHRHHLLGYGSPYNLQRQVGIGIVMGGTGSWHNYYTIDTAAAASSSSSVTGVVVNNVNPTQPPHDLSQVAWALAQSTEYYQKYVISAYQRYLGRTPGAVEIAGWVGDMQHGLSDEQVEAGFIGSAEYIARHGGPGAGWIRSLYRDLLGRSPRQAEVNGWLINLQHGESPQQIAYGFAASAEREAIRIRADYSLYLGRPASQAEVQPWVVSFTHGNSNENVIAGFVGSQEYFQRHGGNLRTWLMAAYQAILHRPADAGAFASWTAVLSS